MTRALYFLGFCSLAVAQSTATDWRFAQPNADLKASINFQTLLKSDAVVKAIEQGKAQAKDNAAQVDLVLAMLSTIDRVAVSAHQKAPNDMDVLVQVTGSFDSQMIAGLFPSTGANKVKVVGPHTILIGEGDSFTHAVERMAGEAVPTSGDELEQSDIWVEAGAALLAQQANQAGQPGLPMLQGLKSLSLGLTLSAAPVINLVLNTADDAGARDMLTTFQAMMPLLTAAAPGGADVGKALSLKQDGAKVRMHFVVPPELLAMAQQQATSGALPSQLSPLLGSFGIGGATSPAKSPKPATSVKPAEAPPQNGGKIVIYGLDDGPKEIPAQK